MRGIPEERKGEKIMINKVMLIGRLAADPEVRYTNDGTAVATFRIATTEKWNNQKGEKEEKTEWHKIVAWRKLGEICGEYLKKGGLVYIEGKLQTHSWEDKEGNKRQSTEVIASVMKMLERASPPDEKTKSDYDDDSNVPF